ncbi:MAG: S8 family serine peptidase, partial [Ornithinibacter sp.]
MVAGIGAVALATTALGATTTTATAQTPAKTSATSGTFQVLAERTVSAEDLARTLAAAGATVTHTNAAIGLVTVTSTDSGFAARARMLDGVKGAAADRFIGRAPVQVKAAPDPVEQEHVFETSRANGSGKDVPPPPAGADPLDGLLWGHEMVHAFEARAITSGGKVRVGILDTGVDGTHLDIAPNFDAALSRNFTKDIPAIDGPCEYAGCVDPADVDNDGHGTHVAGTIGAALNGVGISGIAPEATLVNIRGGQDSGY